MSQENYRIFYNDVPIFINPDLFAAASSVFASHYNPESRDEIAIKCETPVELFKQFLPAVQNMPVKITSENIEALKTMAAEWCVDALTVACEEWERNPCTILDHFLAANERKDTETLNQLADVIAENCDGFVRLKKFMCVPPRLVEMVLKSPKLKIVDHHEVFKSLLAIVNFKREKCSYLLNYVDVDQLSEAEVIALVKSKSLEGPVLGVMMAKCTRRLQQLLAEVRAGVHCPVHLERALREKNAEVRDLERQLKDEMQDHSLITRKLQEMKDKYVNPPDPKKQPMVGPPPQMFASLVGRSVSAPLAMTPMGPMQMGGFMGYPMQNSNPMQPPAPPPAAPQAMPQYTVEKPKSKMYIPPEPRDIGMRPVTVKHPNVSPLMIQKPGGAVIPNVGEEEDSDDPFGGN